MSLGYKYTKSGIVESIYIYIPTRNQHVELVKFLIYN